MVLHCVRVQNGLKTNFTINNSDNNNLPLLPLLPLGVQTRTDTSVAKVLDFQLLVAFSLPAYPIPGGLCVSVLIL